MRNNPDRQRERIERRLQPTRAGELRVVLATGNELAHIVNNYLAYVTGVLELFSEGRINSATLRLHIPDMMESLAEASNAINQTQRLRNVVMKETPSGKALDIKASAEERN